MNFVESILQHSTLSQGSRCCLESILSRIPRHTNLTYHIVLFQDSVKPNVATSCLLSSFVIYCCLLLSLCLLLPVVVFCYLSLPFVTTGYLSLLSVNICYLFHHFLLSRTFHYCPLTFVTCSSHFLS